MTVHVPVCFNPEATERRAAMDRQTSPSQLPTAFMALEGLASYRSIEEAFHCKLKGPVVVDKKTLLELQNFQTVRLLATVETFTSSSFRFPSLCVPQCSCDVSALFLLIHLFL